MHKFSTKEKELDKGQFKPALPAIIKRYKDGQIRSKVWFNHDDGSLDGQGDFSSKVTYFRNGEIKRTEWWKNGQRHRGFDLPADVSYFEDGQISRIQWWFEGNQHRDNNLPADIDYHVNGQIWCKRWLFDHKLHRDNDQPASIFYHDNGQVDQQEWWIDGQFMGSDWEICNSSLVKKNKFIRLGKLES